MFSAPALPNVLNNHAILIAKLIPRAVTVLYFEVRTVMKQQFELTSRKNGRENENGLEKSLHSVSFPVSASCTFVPANFSKPAPTKRQEHDLKTDVYMMSFKLVDVEIDNQSGQVRRLNRHKQETYILGVNQSPKHKPLL